MNILIVLHGFWFPRQNKLMEKRTFNWTTDSFLGMPGEVQYSLSLPARSATYTLHKYTVKIISCNPRINKFATTTRHHQPPTTKTNTSFRAHEAPAYYRSESSTTKEEKEKDRNIRGRRRT